MGKKESNPSPPKLIQEGRNVNPPPPTNIIIPPPPPKRQ